MIGILLCLRRSAASTRRGDARRYTRALRLGALLCLLILIAQIGGYSALSAHLLESSLKTILIGLAGWMLMVMLRGFLEWKILKHLGLWEIKNHGPLAHNPSQTANELAYDDSYSQIPTVDYWLE